jgi:hypothetical protein
MNTGKRKESPTMLLITKGLIFCRTKSPTMLLITKG